MLLLLLKILNKIEDEINFKVTKSTLSCPCFLNEHTRKIRELDNDKKNNRASNNNDTNGSLTSFIVCPIFCILSNNQTI